MVQSDDEQIQNFNLTYLFQEMVKSADWKGCIDFPQSLNWGN